MALSKTINLLSGILIENAYIRIGMVQGNKDGITIIIDLYKNQQSYIDGKLGIDRYYYNYVPLVEENSYNFIKQGYLYLKTLPEYINAIDC